MRTDGFIQKVQLCTTKYTSGSPEEFILSWRSGIEQLRQSEFPYAPIDIAMSFVTLIPQTGALWNELHRKVNAAFQALEIDDVWLDHFFQTATMDAKVDAISSTIHGRASTQSANSQGKRPPIRKACEQCFQSSTTGRFTCSYDHCEHMHRHNKKSDPDDSAHKNVTPPHPKALLSAVSTLEVAEEGEDNNTSTTDVHSSQVNNDIDFESCVEGVDCFPVLLSPLQPPSALLTSNPVALAALVRNCQALFDSGCTHHIIRHKEYFWTYHPEGALSVGTASSGILATKARGIVKLCVRTDAASVVLTLHDCLHGLDSPFNLLSVEAFLEAKMPVNFQTDGYAKVHLLRDNDRLAGQTFTAEIHGRLAFLQCEFLLPPGPIPDDPALPSPAMVFSTFTPQEPDFALWHERLAHAGIESTREVLTGTYGKGVLWNGKI